MIIKLTMKSVPALDEAMTEVYGTDYIEHKKKHFKRMMAPIYSLGNSHQIWLRGRVNHMLNFKNGKGEIVMTEKDNGDLSIHDEVLKESLKENISLEEAKKKVQTEEE